jgi:hypothetical protein
LNELLSSTRPLPDEASLDIAWFLVRYADDWDEVFSHNPRRPLPSSNSSLAASRSSRSWERLCTKLGLRRRRTEFLTQEFWYLFVLSWIAWLDGDPLTMSGAKRALGGEAADRTREKMIQRALDVGWLEERTGATGDLREHLIVPTAFLDATLRDHFHRMSARLRRVGYMPPQRLPP